MWNTWKKAEKRTIQITNTYFLTEGWCNEPISLVKISIIMTRRKLTDHRANIIYISRANFRHLYRECGSPLTWYQHASGSHHTECWLYCGCNPGGNCLLCECLDLLLGICRYKPLNVHQYNSEVKIGNWNDHPSWLTHQNLQEKI